MEGEREPDQSELSTTETILNQISAHFPSASVQMNTAGEKSHNHAVWSQHKVVAAIL